MGESSKVGVWYTPHYSIDCFGVSQKAPDLGRDSLRAGALTPASRGLFRGAGSQCGFRYGILAGPKIACHVTCPHTTIMALFGSFQ